MVGTRHFATMTGSQSEGLASVVAVAMVEVALGSQFEATDSEVTIIAGTRAIVQETVLAGPDTVELGGWGPC